MRRTVRSRSRTGWVVLGVRSELGKLVVVGMGGRFEPASSKGISRARPGNCAGPPISAPCHLQKIARISDADDVRVIGGVKNVFRLLAALGHFGGILQHVADISLIHLGHHCLVNAKGDEALAMVGLTATLGGTSLARAGELHLQDLSSDSHSGSWLGSRGRVNRVSGPRGQPQFLRTTLPQAPLPRRPQAAGWSSPERRSLQRSL